MGLNSLLNLIVFIRSIYPVIPRLCSFADRYMREISAEKIAEFINTKFENTTDEDVFPYNEELITDAYPVFMKFHELWLFACIF